MTELAEPLISARDLSLTFQGAQQILDGLTFDVARSEFVSILGPSGCGKSTLLRLIAGLLEPSNGTVTLAGQTPEAARELSERVGIVFQDPVLLPWRTLEQNIRLPNELSTKGDQPDIASLLRLVGLKPEDAYKRPSQLSGGMRMRASLARALVTEPTLFLLDEPFAALDDVLRQQLNEELLRIREARRCTTVFVTHNVSEAVFLSQRILVLSSSPARIAADIAVPFDYPRASALRGEPEFGRLVQSVSEQLRGAVS